MTLDPDEFVLMQWEAEGGSLAPSEIVKVRRPVHPRRDLPADSFDERMNPFPSQHSLAKQGRPIDDVRR